MGQCVTETYKPDPKKYGTGYDNIDWTKTGENKEVVRQELEVTRDQWGVWPTEDKATREAKSNGLEFDGVFIDEFCPEMEKLLMETIEPKPDVTLDMLKNIQTMHKNAKPVGKSLMLIPADVFNNNFSEEYGIIITENTLSPSVKDLQAKINYLLFMIRRIKTHNRNAERVSSFVDIALEEVNRISDG